MPIMRTNQYVDNRLCDLLLENNITHLDVDLCAWQRIDEINGIMNIFDHETASDRQLALGLIGIITQEEQRHEAIKFYRETYSFSEDPANDREDVVLLLTACLYNPAFFSFALSICEDIKAELVQVEKTKPFITEHPEASTAGGFYLDIADIYKYQFLIKAGIFLRIYSLLGRYRGTEKHRGVRSVETTNGRKNKLDEEIAKYEAVLQTDSNNYDACIMLACLYNNRGGDVNKVNEYCERALNIKSNDPLALFIQGIACNKDETLSELEAILKTNTLMSKEIHYTIGKINFKKGKFEEARKAFEAVKAIDSDFADVNEILNDLLP